MEKVGGVYMIPCKVNGLSLKFVLDTGASNVSISETEALFMLKNGYLNKEDIGNTAYYSLANGDVTEGITMNLREIEIGGVTLKNVKASIVLEQKAPLLLGQTVLEKLGTYKVIENKLILEDYNSNSTNNKLYILDEKNGFKTLKFGTHMADLPSFFQTSKCQVNKNNTATCIIEDAPDELKTVFDKKMDFLISVFDGESKSLTRVQLAKVYRTVVENKDDISFPIYTDYKYLITMYSSVLKKRPEFFEQKLLDLKDIAATEGSVAYWEGNNVILYIGCEVTDIKLDKEYNPVYIFNLKITYVKKDNESIESILDKF